MLRRPRLLHQRNSLLSMLTSVVNLQVVNNKVRTTPVVKCTMTTVVVSSFPNSAPTGVDSELPDAWLVQESISQTSGLAFACFLGVG